MSVKLKRDKKGFYYQWGSQKKYYFDIFSSESSLKAFNKAKKQEKAIETNRKYHLFRTSEQPVACANRKLKFINC